jgi:ribosomal protein S18 acetylase RimI-like enzyme
MTRFMRAKNKASIELAKRLFIEYARSLGFDLCFQDFEKELAGLPGDYAAPSGGLLLAVSDNHIAGCVALRRLEGKVCEMKRLYVRPRCRGHRIGRELAVRIIRMAKKIGYSYMRLDTIPVMVEAIALYRSLGFREIAPYRRNPVHGALYMELELSDFQG